MGKKMKRGYSVYRAAIVCPMGKMIYELNECYQQVYVGIFCGCNKQKKCETHHP